MIIRRARLVPLRSAAPIHPVDLRVTDGIIIEVAPELAPSRNEFVLDADGRWVIPGLWDQHVHMSWWAQARTRLDVSAATSPSDAVAAVVAHLNRRSGAGTVIGFGYRPATWSRQPLTADLDRVSPHTPIIISSGDCHSGWLNSAALRLLGLPEQDGPLTEGAWFGAQQRLSGITAETDDIESAVQDAIADASSRGIVGIVDFEFADAVGSWRARGARRDAPALRVHASIYPDLLSEVVREGLHSGSPLLPDAPLLTMGPLKILTDGSLNARTAYCRSPYADAAELAHPHGQLAYSPDEVTELMTTATHAGLNVCAHAIGDAALDVVLKSFATTGARGRVEHAQLAACDAIATFARLGVIASVQPAHLLDDRAVATQCWPDRLDHCFTFTSFLASGVPLALGSDAPVSALDPWLAMSAAVYRGDPGANAHGIAQDPWNPAESLTAAQALAASVDGADTVAPGSRADLVLLDADPLAAHEDAASVARYLRQMPVALTMVAGMITHDRR